MYGSNEQGFDPNDVRLKKRKVESCEECSVCFMQYDARGFWTRHSSLVYRLAYYQIQTGNAKRNEITERKARNSGTQ